MHTPIVTPSSDSSTEAPPISLPEPGEVLFPEPSGEIALAHLPEAFREVIVELVAISNASPPSIAATALAMVATALGPNAKIAAPGGVISPLFNVVVCHDAPRTLPWFDYLITPFIDQMLKMQTDVSLKGIEFVRQRNAQREKEFAVARKTICPNRELLERLKVEIEQGPARLKPFIACSQVSYQGIAQLFPLTFDSGLALIGLGSDPGEAFTRLKSAERVRITELLNRSWSGTPLSVAGRTFPGVLFFLWQTTRPVSEIMGCSGFDPKFLPVPGLVFEETNSRVARLVGLQKQPAWKAMIERLLRFRYRGTEEVFVFSPEAEVAIDAFEGHLQECGAVLGEIYRHVVWLPDLARRIALLLHLVSNAGGRVLTAPVVLSAIAVTKWLGRQHLRSFILQPKISEDAAETDLADKVEMMYRKICLKAPIMRRELWRSYDSPKGEWFNLVLETLLYTEKVRYNGLRQLVLED